MLTKFLDPKNDLAFKRIFGSEKNKDILLHFLNDIFGRTINPIEDVTFLKSAQDPEVAAQRVSIVDILCKDAEGEHFIIEMQVAHEPGFEKRAQYYAAKTYIQQRDKGVDYKDLKQVTFLAITDYILFPENERYLSHHHILDAETYERHLKDFSFSFLELPKFNRAKEQLKTMTEKWTYFFKNAVETKEEDLASIIGSDLIIKRAYDELDRYAWSPEELRTYDAIDMKQSADKAIQEGAYSRGREEGRQEGREEGRAEGREEGEKTGFEKGEKTGEEKTLINVARNMLKQGLSIQNIVAATGLPADKIRELSEAP